VDGIELSLYGPEVMFVARHKNAPTAGVCQTTTLRMVTEKGRLWAHSIGYKRAGLARLVVVNTNAM